MVFYGELTISTLDTLLYPYLVSFPMLEVWSWLTLASLISVMSVIILMLCLLAAFITVFVPALFLLGLSSCAAYVAFGFSLVTTVNG